MDDVEFLGLERVAERRWTMPVTPLVSAGGLFLFGGCGLGAAIAAVEGSTGRQVVWATAQYLSYAVPGEQLDLEVVVAADGRHITQARVFARVGDREILTVNTALGERSDEFDDRWDTMPDVPSAAASPVRHLPPVDGGSVNDRYEMRYADARGFEELNGERGSGTSSLWAQMPEGLAVSAAGLAVLGDFVPFGVNQALGRRMSINSLDNTLRVGRLVPTEWVLMEIQVHQVARGFGHGLVHLWATDGTLLATASQSCIVREEHPPQPDVDEIRTRLRNRIDRGGAPG